MSKPGNISRGAPPDPLPDTRPGDVFRALVVDIVRAELARMQVPAVPDEYLSTREAADYIGVAPGTVRRWIRAGKLERYHAGGDVRVRRSDLDRLMRSAPERSGAEPTPEEYARRMFG